MHSRAVARVLEILRSRIKNSPTLYKTHFILFIPVTVILHSHVGLNAVSLISL